MGMVFDSGKGGNRVFDGSFGGSGGGSSSLEILEDLRLASDLAVENSIFLLVNGVYVEFIVVYKGRPSTEFYQENASGIWILSKESYIDYENSYPYGGVLHQYLNNTFYNLLGSAEQSCVNQTKIPYCSGNTQRYGDNGILANVFVPSVYEIGYSDSSTYTKPDGKKMPYFTSHEFYGWTRSCSGYTYNYMYYTKSTGAIVGSGVKYPVKPMMILNNYTVIDSNNRIVGMTPSKYF